MMHTFGLVKFDNRQELKDECKRFIQSKGCTLWADFMVDSESGLEAAGQWLATQIEGVFQQASKVTEVPS